jgi:ElaA protein
MFIFEFRISTTLSTAASMNEQSSSLQWHFCHFHELTAAQIHGILSLRCEIFIVEQNCAYQDPDHKDEKSWHLFVTEGKECVGCIRVIPPGVSYPEASVGRFVVKKTYRNSGLGTSLLKRAFAECAILFPGASIRASGQLYLKEFYLSMGFEAVSEVYLEDDIPHIELLKTT